MTVLATAWSSSVASAQDKYTVKVPGGLAFSEFRGYEGWELISTSDNGTVVAAILGNPPMIAAYKKGYPDNGKAFPDGSKWRKSIGSPKNRRGRSERGCLPRCMMLTSW